MFPNLFPFALIEVLSYDRSSMGKQALGKGLNALIGGTPKQSEQARQNKNQGSNNPPSAQQTGAPNTATGKVDAMAPPQKGERVEEVIIDRVTPSPFQPRKQFSSEQLSELVESIREHGVIQPLIVRVSEAGLELIAGERRWRACKEVGLEKVPVIVRRASDQDVLELALIENLQREDLNPIEEAHAYSRLSKEFSLKQEEIASRVGKNRATVANAIRLLDLPDPVQEMLAKKQISVGHAKVLLSLKSKEQQLELAKTISKNKLTVRAAEKLVAELGGGNKKQKAAKKPALSEQELKSSISQVEEQLRSRLSTAVKVQHGKKKGKILIDYYGNEDLERILELIGA